MPDDQPAARPCPHCRSANTRVEPERLADDVRLAGRRVRRYDAVGLCGNCGRTFTVARVEPHPAAERPRPKDAPALELFS